MGCYLHITGILNIGSITWGNCFSYVEDRIREVISKKCSFTPHVSSAILERIHVLDGGNGSIFVAIAAEVQVLEDKNDWETALREVVQEFSSSEGRIEFNWEEEEGFLIAWEVINGKILEAVYTPCHREGYGNACGTNPIPE